MAYNPTFVANTSAAKKYARASARRAVANRSVRSAVKTRITRVRRALVDGELELAAELAVVAVSNLDSAASKGVLHKNNVARRKSRLMKRLNAAGAEAAAPPAEKPKKATTKASAAKSGGAKAGVAKGASKKPAARKTTKK